jgi:PAS domain S-box-containing protein
LSHLHFSDELTVLKKRLAAIFAVAACCIVAGGLAYHHRYQKAIQKDAADLLSSIRHFKTEQLLFWRADRVNDTNSLLDTPVLSLYLNRLSSAPGDAQLKEQMGGRLKSYLKHNRYRSALLALPDGKILVSAGSARSELPPETKDLLLKAAASGKTELGDFYLAGDGKPRLDLAARADSGSGKNKLILVLEIAPEDYLYPLISKWPTNSSTGETILARQEGTDVISLTEFKLPDGAPLRKLSAMKADLPEAKALLGETGTVFGTDYKGEKVLASVGMIPDTGWAIVVKLDWSEIVSDAGRGSALILLFTLFMLFTAAALAYMLFRLQEAGYSRRLDEAETEKEKYKFNYETLSNKANDMIFLADLQDRSLVMVNSKACQVYGYTEEEMLRLKPENLIPPENLKSFNARFEAMARGAALVYETTHIKKNGEHFPIEVSATGVRQGGRDLVHFICRDITERKRLENDLREKERTLAGLMYNLPGMVYRCKNDPHWTMEFVSQGCEKLTGYKPAELLGNNSVSYSDIITPEDRDMVWRLAQTALAAGRPYQLSYKIRRKDGSICTVWEQGDGVRDKDGRVAVLEGLVIDNTDKAEAAAALRESQENYKHLFETMDEGFSSHEIICDPEGRPVDYRFLDVNPAFERLTGLKRETIIGKTLLEVMPKTERLWIETYGKVALTGQRTHFENYAAELGKWFEVSAFSPRRGRFATTFFDITPRKESELRTENLNKELSKSLRLYTVLAQINQAAAQLKDRKKLFERVCEIAVTAGNFKMAWIGYPDQDTGRVLPLAFYGEGKGGQEALHAFLHGGAASKGPTGDAAAAGTVSARQDIGAGPESGHWKEQTSALGYASAAAIPIYEGEKISALLTLYSDRTDAFPEEEMKMLTSLQAETGLAIAAISAEEQRAEAQAGLERTAAHLTHAMEATPIVLFTTRVAGNRLIPQWVTGNPKAITGNDHEEILSPDWFENALHPDDRQRVLADAAALQEKGSVTHDFRLKKKDGSGYAWVRSTIKASTDTPGEITGYWTDITQLKEAELRCQAAIEHSRGQAKASD